jgi:hypothetical protein
MPEGQAGKGIKMPLQVTAPIGGKFRLVLTASTRKGLRITATIRRSRKASRKGSN